MSKKRWRMHYKVYMTDEAVSDVYSLTEYIRKELCNNDAAIKLYERLGEQIRKIGIFPAKFPGTGFMYRGYIIYKKVFKTYLIFYIINEFDKSVYILRVLKNKMNWKNILGTLKEYHFTDYNH